MLSENDMKLNRIIKNIRRIQRPVVLLFEAAEIGVVCVSVHIIHQKVWLVF